MGHGNREVAEEIHRIASAALPHAKSLLSSWLPDGRMEGHEYVARNPTRSDTKPGSFKVNTRTGLWADYAVDGAEGGDLIKLRAYLNGKLGQPGAQVEAAKEIASQLGIEASFRTVQDRDEKRPPRDSELWKLVKTYDYDDLDGSLVMQVLRYEADAGPGQKSWKDFRQRRPGDDGEWIWSTKGHRQVPYRLTEISEAIASEQVVFVVEGEKPADALAEIGAQATCNPGGALKWTDQLNQYFSDADVVILPDNDTDGKGRRHALQVAEHLSGVAKRVRLLDLPDLPPKGDAYEWVRAGGTLEDLHRLVEHHALPWNLMPPESKFGAVPWWCLDMPGREHEWLIKGLLTCGERSMIAGPSQSGKSFLALDIAMAVARGVPYWGQRARHGGVLYQAGEGGLGIKKRLRAYRVHNDLGPEEQIPFVLLPEALDLHASEEATDAIIDEAHRWDRYLREACGVPVELIVIDTLATATPGADENSGADMSRVLRRCQHISQQTGAHVMLVHHMNASGQKPRGHTSIKANLEQVILVKSEDDVKDSAGRPVRTAIIDKQKDAEAGLRWRFVLRGGIRVGVDEDGDPITSCVVDAPEGKERSIHEQRTGGGRAPDRRSSKSARETIALRALEEALIESGCAAPQSLGLPAGVRVVEYRAWVQKYIETSFHEDQDQAKRALATVGANLLARRAIGRSAPYVWPVKQAAPTDNEAASETTYEHETEEF